jgi:lipoprotein-releasing system permease protein
MTSIFSTPSLMRFRVVGIFETGIFEYDDNFGYISLSSAQKLYDMGSTVTGIEYKLDNMNRAETVKTQLSEIRVIHIILRAGMTFTAPSFGG